MNHFTIFSFVLRSFQQIATDHLSGLNSDLYDRPSTLRIHVIQFGWLHGKESMTEKGKIEGKKEQNIIKCKVKSSQKS